MRGQTLQRPVSAPSKLLTVFELRALGERVLMSASSPLLRNLPKGDGHRVVVLPGFTADDRSTEPLRAVLSRLGYDTSGWGLGSNLGPNREIVDGLDELLSSKMADDADPISLIGWSLGGIFARQLTVQHPASIRQVITLGCPIQMIDGDRSAGSSVWESLSHTFDPAMIDTLTDVPRQTPTVPTTSIYSRTDGIVRWQTCLDDQRERSENVEVYGSHCGLGFNPSVAFVLADRLAQSADDWRPFRPPLVLRALYPKPAPGPT